jgi:hypothetical protein
MGNGRRILRWALLVSFFGLLAALPVCFAVAMRFQVRKHELSGVPVNHLVVNENGRLFYVPRMGYPVGERPEFPLSATQYDLWQENQGWSAWWGWMCGVCFITALAIGVAADRLWRNEARGKG